MLSKSKVSKCDLCGENGKVVYAWTKNRYGKRYYYKKIYHGSTIHYIPLNTSKNLKKGLLRNFIIDLLSGEGFRIRIFTVKEIREKLMDEGIIREKLTYQNIRNSLMQLIEEGFIESKTINGKKIFINKIPELNNRYEINALTIELIDENNSGYMATHRFIHKIMNPTDVTLYYFIFMIYGDSPQNREQLKFQAGSEEGNFEIKYHFVHDEPTIKKILLSFNKGIKSGEEKSIWIEYHWPDEALEYLVGFSTEVRSLTIKIISDMIKEPRCEIIDMAKSIKRDERLIRKLGFQRKLYELNLAKLSAGELILIKWSIAQDNDKKRED